MFLVPLLLAVVVVPVSGRMILMRPSDHVLAAAGYDLRDVEKHYKKEEVVPQPENLESSSSSSSIADPDFVVDNHHHDFKPVKEEKTKPARHSSKS